MTATGVTFAYVPITWPSGSVAYSEGTPSNLSAIIAKDIQTVRRGTKFEQPIPPSSPVGPDKPVFYPMGSTGKTIKLISYLKTPTNFALWDPIVQGNLLKVISGEYTDELPLNSYWWVETNDINRKAGMGTCSPTGTTTGLWNHELTVIRSWRKGDQVLR